MEQMPWSRSSLGRVWCHDWFVGGLGLALGKYKRRARITSAAHYEGLAVLIMGAKLTSQSERRFFRNAATSCLERPPCNLRYTVHEGQNTGIPPKLVFLTEHVPQLSQQDSLPILGFTLNSRNRSSMQWIPLLCTIVAFSRRSAAKPAIVASIWVPLKALPDQKAPLGISLANAE